MCKLIVPSLHISQLVYNVNPRCVVTELDVTIFSIMIMKYSRDQLTFVVFGALYNFFTWMACCLESTFFPMEAEAHGVSPTIYGLISSIFDWVAVFISPLLICYLHEKYILMAAKTSPFIISISCLLWTLLKLVESKGMFILTSSLLRFSLGVGNSLLFVSSSTLITKCFQETDAVLSIMLAAQYLGVVSGSILGGVLLDAIGFVWTFASFGLLVTVVGIPFIFLLKFNPYKVSEEVPRQTEEAAEESPKEEARSSVLKKVVVWLCLLILIIVASMVTFPYIALEPHLRSFNLSHTQIGLVFILCPSMFAISNTICGFLSSKIGYIISFLTCTITACVGYSLIAPIPIYPVETNLPMLCVGLAMFGWGGGGVFLISLLLLVNESEDSKFVMGIWQSAYEVGNALGGAAGGLMIDYLGFPNSTMLLIGLTLILTILLVTKLLITFIPSLKA